MELSGGMTLNDDLVKQWLGSTILKYNPGGAEVDDENHHSG